MALFVGPEEGLPVSLLLMDADSFDATVTACGCFDLPPVVLDGRDALRDGMMSTCLTGL